MSKTSDQNQPAQQSGRERQTGKHGWENTPKPSSETNCRDLIRGPGHLSLTNNKKRVLLKIIGKRW